MKLAIKLFHVVLGKLRSVGYCVYVIVTGFVFSQGPLVPALLDLINPLNETRYKPLFVRADYFMDPYENYYKLHTYFTMIASLSMTVFSGIDGIYTAVVHQYLAILSIVKHRLQRATDASNVEKNRDYDMLIEAILLHRESIEKWCGIDIDLCCENASGAILVTGMVLKGLVLVIHRDKLKIMLNKIAKNWFMLSDPEERKIILEYAALGKWKSVGYFVYIASTGIMYTQGPLFPVFLDLIKPLNESREKIQILKAEYIIDPIENYYKIYAYLCINAACGVIVISGIDGFYTVIVHQYLAILAIVKYRLQIATKSYNVQLNRDYNIIVDAILLHQESLLFNEIINATYSTIFLVANIFTIMYMCGATIVTVNILEDFEIGKDLFELVRVNMFLIGALIHLLYLTWPGQSILSQSEDLLVSAYANEWYNISRRSKKLLKILMLRLAKPSVVTAGGISVMNFESYGAILKSAASYLTVLLSFRN